MGALRPGALAVPIGPHHRVRNRLSTVPLERVAHVLVIRTSRSPPGCHVGHGVLRHYRFIRTAIELHPALFDTERPTACRIDSRV